MPPEQVQAEEEATSAAAEQAAAAGKSVEPVIDWESESNPYRRRYEESQGQVKPLTHIMHQYLDYDYNTKTWKPKTQAVQPQPVDADKVFEGYDPEFVKAISGYVAPLKDELTKLREERQASEQMAQYSFGVKASQAKAIEEFGDEYEFAKNGKFNTESPLYKLANEILTVNYAQFHPDGTFYRFSLPNAEYLSTVEAYAILSKRTKQSQLDKGKLGAIQGRGTKSAGVKKSLTYEEYSKLSNDQKDVYDLQQTG